MASPPGGWKTTRAKTRHLKVWLKNSITSLSHAETVFDNASQDDEQHNVAAAMIKAEQHARMDDDNDVMVVALLCHTIDQAMNALHDGSCEKLMDASDFQAFSLENEYDWILDGHVSFPAEQERSQQLLRALRGPNLDDLFPQSSGRQNDDTSSDEEDDEFGGYQTAPDDPSRKAASPSDRSQEAVGNSPARETNESECHPGKCVDEVESHKSSQVAAVGECSIEAAEEFKIADRTCTEEEDNLGDVPREIFPSPLHHVERALLHHQHDKVDPLILYSSLPELDNVSSPEGRFTRRQHLEASDDEHDETDLRLAEQYFSNPTWDPVLEVLRRMPWQHVSILHTDTDPTIVDEYITQRLSQVDASFALCNSMIMKQASKQSRLLSQGNAVVHEMPHTKSVSSQ